MANLFSDLDKPSANGAGPIAAVNDEKISRRGSYVMATNRRATEDAASNQTESVISPSF